MSIQTALTQRLGIRNPVLLAPMDVVADARLTSAVSAAGGLGILGGGYGDAEWLTREIARLKETQVRFGIGFITWSLAKQPHLLDLALESAPAAIMLSFGDAAPFAEPVKRSGAALICQVQTLDMARKAVSVGADILVAQGTEAGGHGASRATLTLVPELVDAIGPDVPVVAAGGIADGRGLAAALMLGASGVLMGTRFYATKEAAVAAEAKARVQRATGDETARGLVFDIVRKRVWPVPFTGRCLRNALVERWTGRELELVRHADEEHAKFLAAREAGDFDIAAVIAGEAAGLVRDIPSAREVVERVSRDAEALLDGASQRLRA
ncbi:nitronate monooxygenase [Variovorax ureilyticus]|uniref:Nitronate monooxygenase n=1 Tax=Variovorax ureilyticus TaxID=1836198 RepID=A0ABU8VMB9_9BURK